MSILRILLLAASLQLTQAANSGQSGIELVNRRNFRRALHNVAVLGDYLYLEGGEIFDDKDNSTPLNETVSVPLDTSWSISDVEYRRIPNHSPPPIERHALWADTQAGLLYRYGGATSHLRKQDESNHRLWQFTPGKKGAGVWTMSPASNPGVFGQFGLTSNGLSTYCDGLGFYSGGSGLASTDPAFKGKSDNNQTPVPGLLIYNSTNHEWSNETQPIPGPLSGVRMRGGAQCTSQFSDGPLALFFGGVRAKGPEVSDFKNMEIADMSIINIYDPAQKKWFFQKATGYLPKNRDAFCSVGVQSANSYEIFVYGGRGYDNTILDDVYILSLPGFVWFKVDSTTGAGARVHHACAVGGKRQLLASGGLAKIWDWKSSDPWPHALGVFDMTALKWNDHFDADASEYQSPQMVQDWYQDGGFDRVAWTNDEVKNMFSNSTGGPMNDPGSKKSKKKTNVGAIVGGVVGGIAAIGLIGVALFFWHRKHRSSPPKYEHAVEADGEQKDPAKNSTAEVGTGHRHEMPSNEEPGRVATPAAQNQPQELP